MAKTDGRQAERNARAGECCVVGGLPDFPGILAAMKLSSDLEGALRALADTLLVKAHTGATVSRADREILATAVSAGNNCFFCMDTHGAFAAALLKAEGVSAADADQMVDGLKAGTRTGIAEKLQRLIDISLIVREDGRRLGPGDVDRALAAGATNEDVQLAVLIASAFSMYNRMVDGFRARTPADPAAHRARAEQIAQFGYVDTRVTAVPATAPMQA
jgi:AhpD family alkylhydroperoxidase